MAPDRSTTSLGTSSRSSRALTAISSRTRLLRNVRRPMSTSIAPHLTRPEEIQRSLESGILRVASMNLSTRNTNPLEFELKGDSSEVVAEAMSMLRKAKKAVKSVEEGPCSLPSTELELIMQILAEVYTEENEDGEPEGRTGILGLLQYQTWDQVMQHARTQQPHLFNALNLASLALKRPSVWENPASCRRYSNTHDYLAAWLQWYRSLDRDSSFWLEDAPRLARKRSMNVATAFAGLLLFDVMCVCAARCAIQSANDDIDDAREVQFAALERFAAELPASNPAARHSVAASFIEGVDIIFTQETGDFSNHPAVAEHFRAPFWALDGFTAVILRKEAFEKAYDISTTVAKKMTEVMIDTIDTEAAKPSLEASWRTTASHMAVVHCRCNSDLGGFLLCLVSLQCSDSEHAAAFIEALQDVLTEYNADINIVGLNSNCSSNDAVVFQRRLGSNGFEIGCTLGNKQVTVAKQRTCFQTQLHKTGKTVITHQDYIVSWGSAKAKRGITCYTPDLRTPYGVEQESKQCIYLPTSHWPFDHCSVLTAFDQRHSCCENKFCTRGTLFAVALVFFLIFLLTLPVASPERSSPYGMPGTWHHSGWSGTPRTGICEAAVPCPDDGAWQPWGASCYVPTPKLAYFDAQRFCHRADGELVSIGSEAENQFISGTLCPQEEFCWIGLRSDDSKTKHWWQSGEPVTFNRLEIIRTQVLPIFPMSRDLDWVGTMVANWPGEISSCRLDFVMPFQRGGKLLGMLNLLSPAVSMVVSATLLLLLPAGQSVMNLYFTVSLSVNIGWWLTKMGDVCFTSDINTSSLLFILGTWLDQGGHTFTALASFWLILRRIRVLRSARLLTAIFWFLLSAVVVLIVLGCLFVDTSASITSVSLPVVLLFVDLGIFTCLYLLIAIWASSDLHSTWRMLQLEEATGRHQGGSALRKEVRSAKLHFLGVLAALFTSFFRWLVILVAVGLWTQPGGMEVYTWAGYFIFASALLDSTTNDICAYLLATHGMDVAVVRAKGIANEVVHRAHLEVEQHAIAVRVLKAAPTSAEQLRHFALLEGRARAAAPQDPYPFLELQSAIRVESARIHWMMQCVRLRAMTMPVRYQYLIEVPIIEGAPRQHVPARYTLGGETSVGAASEYFDWLYNEADAAQHVFFRQVWQLIRRFNKTPWPSDLGLAREQFPWTIWPHGPEGTVVRQLHDGENISPGDILCHDRKRGGMFGQRALSQCYVLEETSSSHTRIQRCGNASAEVVPREELRICNGGGVFIPGPKKRKQRCLDKIAGDYEGKVPWPAAASVTDICRCMVVLDDPYAVAVFVAYLQRRMRVVRLKNRFSEDFLEAKSPEELQAMFSAATHEPKSQKDDATQPVPSETTAQTPHSSGNAQFRDISINVEVTSPSGVPFICEMQVTLSSLAILKHADTKLYTVRRMRSAQELQATYVFSEEQACLHTAKQTSSGRLFLPRMRTNKAEDSCP